MAAPNDGQGQYPPQQYAQEAQYGGYEDQTSPPLQAGVPVDGGKKKKRGYATQAFEFGSGANAGATGAPPPGGMPPMPSAGGYAGTPQPAQGYGGYQAPAYDQGGYASPAPVPYDAQQPGIPVQPAAAPGYQAPSPYYAGAVAGGLGPITANMAGMNLGGPQQPAAQQQPPAQQQPRLALNQLYPTDLLNQPFNVSELDLPPPPCILPPNVCIYDSPPIVLLAS
jgi:protein transport protein SEC24